jgi:iron complex outermembrane receptor protein
MLSASRFAVPGVRRPVSVAVAACFGLCCIGAAQAQESDIKLKEISVSAETDKPVQQRTELGKLTEYTPISGATVDREEIEHLQLVNILLELGKRVPGISMVRNMRIPDGGKNYTENRVDGMRVSSTSNTSLFDEVDLSNVERIDIVTGPGSALYGSGALGGTISVFSRQPPRDFKARLSQEVGSWGLLRTAGNVGTSTADGRFGFLFNASTMDNDGWRKNMTSGGQDAAEEHKDGAAVKLLFRPTNATKLSFGYDRLRYEFGVAGAIPLYADGAASLKNASINGTSLRDVYWDNDWQQTVPGTYGRSINNYETISANLQHLVGERGELSLGVAQRTDDYVDYGAAGSGGSRSVICDNVTVLCSTYNSSGASTNTLKRGVEVAKSARLMYRQDFDLAKSSLYLGAELIDITTDSATYNNNYTAAQGQLGLWGVGTKTATGQGAYNTEKDTTPFVHFEFSPLERLRFHIGERFDKIDYASDDRTASNRDAERSFRNAVTKSGVTYDLARNHLIWGNLSQTFNAPALSTLLDTNPQGTAGNTLGSQLNPEKGLTKEIGLRGLFADYGLHYDVAFYHSRNKGFVVSRDCTTDEAAAYNLGASCKINENAGSLTATGLETMLSWAATSWLDVGVTYSNARAYFNDYKTITVDYSGNSYQAMPRQRLNLRLAVKPAHGWRVELEADHVSDYYVDNANSGTYSRPDLYSLRASYRPGKDWSFWLHAINLTDEKYATRVGYSTLAGRSVLAASAGQGNSGTYVPLTLRAGVSLDF